MRRAASVMARGSGEGVKFRESRFTLEAGARISQQQWRVDMALDLKALGMRPGDELYFYLEARDNRAPQAQSSRSDTYFVVWQDTAEIASAIHTGLLITPIPEYFRSQRQIIIDTEKLLRDRPRLAEEDFKRYSQNLGLDQQALRLRYGQFLGEESESATEVQNPSGELPKEHGGEGESAHRPSKPSSDKTGAEEILNSFAHKHDVEENATLFAPSVKTQLKAALVEMWEAELRLRTHRPQEALPYEYRALTLLKAVQQSTRAYVQRVGFEPPPIKIEEKRLSGNLEKVANARWQKKISATEALSELREALAIVANLRFASKTEAAQTVEILERAGQELARQALAQPGRHLQALQDLRTLIAAYKNGGVFCESCALTVQRALWQALPPVEPRPAPQPPAATSLAEKYFMRLHSAKSP